MTHENIAIAETASEETLVPDVETAKALLRAARQERDECNHRIANSLQQVASFLKSQARQDTGETAADTLLTAEIRVQAIAQIHRQIYTAPEADLMDTQEYLSGFVANLETALGMTIKTACAPVMLPPRMVTQFAIIVSELSMNALKHAKPTNDKICAILQFGQDGDLLLLSFRDNGAGLPEAFTLDEPGTGMGLLIILRAVEQLGGTLTAQSNAGAVFTLKVPAPQIG